MSIQSSCSRIRYIVLDLEVNGIGSHPWINQLGAVDPERPKVDRVFNRYFEPPQTSPHLARWTEKYEAVDRSLVSGCRKGFLDFFEWVNPGLKDTRPLAIVGHNAYKHDKPIFMFWLAECNIKMPDIYNFFCTAYLSNALKIPGDKTLSGLSRTLGVKYRVAHDAVNDAKMTNDLFKKMVGSAPMDEVLRAAMQKSSPVVQAAEVIRKYAVEGFNNLSGLSKTVERSQNYPAMKYLRLDGPVANLSKRVHNVYLDLETTGLFPKAGEKGDPPRVVQLAIHIPSKNTTIDIKINPEMSIPKRSSAVHRLFDKDVAEAMKFREAWLFALDELHVKLDVKPGDIIIVNGYNLWGYDWPVVKAECARTGLGNVNFNTYDTLTLGRTLFKGLVNGELLKGFFKLEYLAPLLGINVHNAHDASVDVALNAQVFDRYVEGVDLNRLYQGMLTKPPVLGVGILCREQGTFNPEAVMKNHKTACELTIPLIKRHMKGMKNPAFFEPRNLAAVFDIDVAMEDKERFILWRIFLKVTEGMDRKIMLEALTSENPLESIFALDTAAVEKRLADYLVQNRGEGQLTLTLGKSLLMPFGITIPDLNTLALTLDVDFFEEKPNPFEIKRMFLKLTQGLQRNDIKPLLDELGAVQQILDLIKTEGTFDLDDCKSDSTRSKRLQPESIEAGSKYARTR